MNHTDELFAPLSASPADERGANVSSRRTAPHKTRTVRGPELHGSPRHERTESARMPRLGRRGQAPFPTAHVARPRHNRCSCTAGQVPMAMPISSVEPSAAAPPSRPPERRPGASRYADIYGGVLWPAWERLVRGRSTPRHLAFVEAMQWRPAEEIERYQVEALRALLAHAGRNVPYWRELFARLRFDARDLRRREDLSALPVLTRDVVRERYHDLVDPAFARDNLKRS